MWRKLKQNLRQRHVVLLTAPSVAGTLILLSLTGIFQLLEWATLDQFFRLRPEKSPDPRIVIVGINESDIAKLGRWSMSDADLAQLLTQIKKQQPRVIGLDLFRNLSQEPGKQTLTELFRSTPNLIGVEKTVGETIAPPPVLAELDQVGSADIILDSDNKVRRGLLSIETEEQLKFSFGVKLAFKYLESEGIKFDIVDENQRIYSLGESKLKPLRSNDGGYVRVNTGGYQILLNFRGSAPSFPIISMTDVLENNIPPDLMRDRIVLIGTMASSLKDFFYTPYNANESSQTPGVEVHAHLTSQLISAALEGRSLIQTVPDSLEWLSILFWSTCSAILGANFLRQRWLILLSIHFLGVILALSSYGAFLLGWWIPIVPSLLAILASGTTSIVYILWENLTLSYQKLEDYAQTLEEKVAKRTEQLRLSEQMFVSIFRSTPNPITITARKNGKHLLVNETFCELTGYDPEEVLDRTAIELNLWVNTDSRAELFTILNTEGKVRNYEGDFRTKAGEVRTALLSAEIIDFDGEECLLSVSNDITERKAAEKELKKAKEAADAANKTKSEFLANMSHELRTPLNAILGFTRLMGRIPFPVSEQHNYLDIIGRSGEHLLSLINDVLDLSKIEAGRITFNENSFSLAQLLATLQDMFTLKAESKGLQLIVEHNSDYPQYIKTDESKLRQVLINLLSNAIKFTDEGNITLRVRRENQNTSPCILHFEVEDTGTGIAPQELSSIFDPFVQTATGRQSQQGTGLGLSISQKFVRLMGGEIIVKSILGQGTAFNFYIQVHTTEEDESLTPESKHKVIGLAPNQPSYRILVVEDTWESRTLLVKLLKFVGFEAEGAKNGQEAVEIWHRWEPHLIWMDMRMPVMNGYEATKQIKGQLKGQATVIIALTASVFEAEKSAILAIGCDDFVHKPVQEEIIFRKMSQYLGVRYLYEDTVSSDPSTLSIAQVDPQTLQSQIVQMPVEWITQLQHAASEGNDLAIEKLLEEISQENQVLKTVLRDWNHEFQFDKILEVTRN